MVNLPKGGLSICVVCFDCAITDTGGQTTKVSYNSSGVTIALPDGSTVVYALTKSGNYSYLTRKTNQMGQITTYEYSNRSGNFDFFSTGGYGTGKGLIYYHLLTSANYPTGASTKYNFVVADGSFGTKGLYQYYRISSRYDLANSTVYNNESYSYTNNNYTGYPTFKESDKLDSSFSYETTVTYSNGVTKIYTFNNKHLMSGVKLNYNGTRKFEEQYTYDANKQPTSMTSIAYGSGVNQSATELYTYDIYGNLTEFWDKRASGNKSNTEYKKTYTYNANYNMLTSVSYKKDSATTLREDYALTNANRSAANVKTYENGAQVGMTSFSYDTYGNIASKNEYTNGSSSIATTYGYQNGIFVATETRAGVTLRSTYDVMGRVLSTTNGNGYSSSYQYDKKGRMLRTTNPDSSIITNVYDDSANTLTTTNEIGLKIKNSYDKLGNLTLVQDVTGSAITLNSYTYDNLMRLSSETDSRGAATTYGYDFLDRVTSKTMGSGLYRETYTYEDVYSSAYSRVTKTIEGDASAPSMKTCEYVNIYGFTDKTSRFINCTEYADTFTLDYLGNKTNVTTADGKVTSYAYDYAGRLVKTTNPDGSVYQTAYDWLGRKTSTTDPKNNVAIYTYDSFNNLTKEELPFEGSTKTMKSYVYDKNGNVTSKKMTNNMPGSAQTESRTDYEYNNRNLAVKVSTFNKGGVENYTTYKYDAAGNMTEMLMANGAQKTAYEYNKQSRLVTLTDPLGQFEAYTYDNIGNLTSKTDRNKTVIANTYDLLNRLTRVSMTKSGGAAAAPEFAAYTYAKTGAKVREQNENLTTDFVYDDAGRLAKQTESNSVVKTYTYDINDNRKSFVLDQNGAARVNQTYDYDNMNRLTKVYDSGTLQATYTYDQNGNRASLTYPNGIVTTYAYNNANLVTSLANKKGSTTVSSFTYTYRLDGNQTGKTENTGRTTAYTYDDLGRLTNEAETYQSGAAQTMVSKAYTFDKANNRQTMSVAKTGENSYTTSYIYDNNNRLLSEVKETSLPGGTKSQHITDYKYDSNGNQLSKASCTLTGSLGDVVKLAISMIGLGAMPSLTDYSAEINTFDVFNRLVKTENENGAIAYKYKADGMRLSKSMNGQTTTHVWDGGNIALELSGSAVTGKYIRGVNLIKNQNGDFYLFNAHGDVVQLSNSTGSITMDYHYDAFGVEESRDDADTNPWRYCGEYSDSETGSIYLRARYYTPYNGRFMGEDPVRSGLNWYTYCSNNAVRYVDPSGLWSLEDNNRMLARLQASSSYASYLSSIGVSGPYSDYAKNNSWISFPGFEIDQKQGIYYTKYDAWQGNWGYHDIFDSAFGVVGGQAAPFYFSYDNEDWRLEFWKGYYLNLGTGGEIGLYYESHNPVFNTVDVYATSRNRPQTMNMNLFATQTGKDYQSAENIFVLWSQDHWWLGGFKPGMYTYSSNLIMAGSITFETPDMARAFYDAQAGNLYGFEAKRNNSTVSFLWQ